MTAILMTTSTGEFVCPADFSDRLDRALSTFMVEMSRTKARRLIDAGSVFIDGRRCRVAGRTVRSGDRIRVASIDPPARDGDDASVLRMLCEDDDWIAIDKPAGMPSAPTQERAAGTALDVLRQRQRIADPRRVIHLVHRLDAATSGILMFAKNATSAAMLGKQFASGEVRKEYLAIVGGRPATSGGCIDAPLARSGGKASVCDAPHGRAARTEWHVLASLPPGTLLRVLPQSGRMHQIRVHLAHIGHAIVGDRLYGGAPAPRLMLHASRLELVHPTKRQRVVIACAAPFAPEPAST